MNRVIFSNNDSVIGKLNVGIIYLGIGINQLINKEN